MMRVAEVVCNNCVIKNLCPRSTLKEKKCWLPNMEERKTMANQYEKAKNIVIRGWINNNYNKK
jgi:hypothetical protein